MSKNNRQNNNFYLSQVTKNSQPVPSPKLYTSGAYSASSQKSPVSPTNNNYISSRVNSKRERAIDSISSGSNHLKCIQLERELVRNRSAEQMRWQSPSRFDKGCFRSIIEQINENNDKTIEQLDVDLKRIKGNLQKVEEQIATQKQITETEALYEQIQLLQEENQRLRDKNLELGEEKKKLTQSLDHFQSVAQLQMARKNALASSSKSDEGLRLMKQKIQLETALKEKTLEYDQLRQQSESFQKLKLTISKKEEMLLGEKAKLSSTVSLLQKEIESIKNDFQEKLIQQLSKKQQIHMKAIQKKSKEFEDSMRRVAATHQAQLMEVNKSRIIELEGNMQELEIEKHGLKIKEQQQTKEVASLQQQLIMQAQKIDMLTNQNQFLTFNHQQINDSLIQQQSSAEILQGQLNQLKGQLKQQEGLVRQLKSQLLEERNKYQLLQELNSRLEKESRSYQTMSQQHLKDYKEALSRSQEQVNRLKMRLNVQKEEVSNLQFKLHQANQQQQSLLFQSNKKKQEVMLLKQQLILLNEKKPAKMESHFSPPSHPQIYQRRERFNSGDSRAYYFRERQSEYQGKVRAMQKQMDNLMKEYKLQLQKEKSLFKQKQKQLKASSDQQLKKIQELTLRQQTMKKEFDQLLIERLRKQEQLLSSLQLKQGQVSQLEQKFQSASLQLQKLEMQLQSRQKEGDELKKQIQKQEAERQKQLQRYEQQQQLNEKFVENLLFQIKSIAQNSDHRHFQLYQHLKNSSFVTDLRTASNLNFTIHALQESFSQLHRKIKQLEYEQQLAQNSSLQSLQQPVIYENYKTAVRPSPVPKIASFLQQQYPQSEVKQQWTKDLLSRLRELQRKMEFKTASHSRIQAELEQQKELVVKFQAETFKLRDQIQSLEVQLSEKQKIIKDYQQQLKETSEKDKNPFIFHTPIKEHQISPVTVMDMSETRELQLRNRIRSAKFQSPLSRRDSQLKNESAQLLQYELANTTLQRSIQQKKQEIEQLRASKTELSGKLKCTKQLYQQKAEEIAQLEETLSQYKKKKAAADSKIKYLQNDNATFAAEVETLTEKCNDTWEELINEREVQSATIRQYTAQKQALQRKYKNQLLQKDSKIINLTQMHQLRVVELQAEIGKLKDLLRSGQFQQDVLTCKMEKVQQEQSMFQQRCRQKELQVKRIQMDLQEQKKNGEKAVQKYKQQLQRLTRQLQQKEIEVQELKFIQESNVINRQSAKKQGKPQNDSIYSFKYDL